MDQKSHSLVTQAQIDEALAVLELAGVRPDFIDLWRLLSMEHRLGQAAKEAAIARAIAHVTRELAEAGMV